MRDNSLLLEDILESIQKIEKYVVQGKDVFEQDELIQTWIVHHMQILGEAANKLSQDLTHQHPQVPWKQIIGMRNILVHDYFGVDLNEVWTTATQDLPKLQSQIEVILQQLSKT